MEAQEYLITKGREYILNYVDGQIMREDDGSGNRRLRRPTEIFSSLRSSSFHRDRRHPVAHAKQGARRHWSAFLSLFLLYWSQVPLVSSKLTAIEFQLKHCT